MTDSRPEFPGFEIIAEMGRGTTGVVYQARFVPLDRIVALKTTVADADTLSRRRIVREARILAGLSSKPQTGIPKLHLVGEVKQRPYYARAYVDGETLESVAQRGRINLRDSVAILQQVAEIVAHIHYRRLVHCNLQPSNILLATDRRAWLIGFGRCKALDTNAVRGVPITTDADVRALQQMLNWLCATLSPELPDWIAPVRQRPDVASALEFGHLLTECLDEQ